LDVQLDREGRVETTTPDGERDGWVRVYDADGRLLEQYFDSSISPYDGRFDLNPPPDPSSNFGQTGYVISPQVGGYVSSPQVGGYVGSPQVGGYVGSPTIGATPVYYNTTRIYYDPNTGTYYTA